MDYNLAWFLISRIGGLVLAFVAARYALNAIRERYGSTASGVTALLVLVTCVGGWLALSSMQ